MHSLACFSPHSQTDSPLHIPRPMSTYRCACQVCHTHHDKRSSASLQQARAYSAFSNAGEHKMLCWCCSPFCVQRYMGTVGWMGLRGGPCYLLAASWHSLAKLSCTCTASSWKLSDRGERHFHRNVWLRMHAPQLCKDSCTAVQLSNCSNGL